MRRKRGPLAGLAVVALIGVGCGSAENGSAGTGSSGANKTATNREKAMRFAKCMRDNGVTEFPDPNASGELTIDGIANRSSLDTNTAAFKQAIGACRDLEPPGFTGHTRSAQQQKHALEFAQCMRDNGIKDFPDPTRDGPLIDTTRIPSAAGRGARSIPGFQAATQKCTAVYSGELGVKHE
jgi:hypothetical protein